MSKQTNIAGAGRALVTDAQVRDAMANIAAGKWAKDEAARLGISPPSLSTRIKKLREALLPQPSDFQLRDLKERVLQLEATNHELRRQLAGFTDRARGGSYKHERRDQIEAVLDDGDLLTYEDIAQRIGSTANRVRATVASMNGAVEKFHLDGSNTVYIRKVSQ